MAQLQSSTICFDLEAFRRWAQAERHLLVELGSPPAAARGGLSSYVASRIEDRLDACGALPRAGCVPLEPRALLTDQVYRARLLGREGLALAFDSLESIAPQGVLNSDDSTGLRAWVEAAKSASLRVGLPPHVRDLRGYDRPVTFDDLLDLSNQETGPPDDERASAEAAPAPLVPEQERHAAAPGSERKSQLSETETTEGEASGTEVGLITRGSTRARSAPAERQIALFIDGASDDGSTTTELSEEVTLAQRAREHSEALASASGTQSFSSLEALFLTAYAPLREILNKAPASYSQYEESATAWARQFEACYSHAFEQVRARRQRPLMVFDAPKIAFRLARAELATGFQLVLVDGLRFDVGQRVHDKLRLQLSGQAECVERGVLWAPLPSTTGASLELLARGADGLRDLSAELSEADVVSVKEARRLRKLRAGPHSLFKLDAVQVSLEPDKAWDIDGLNQLAAEVAVSVGRFIRQQARGSMVLLFGDHGFKLEDGSHGDATPEEVLVPYQAWRVADGAASSAERPRP